MLSQQLADPVHLKLFSIKYATTKRSVTFNLRFAIMTKIVIFAKKETQKTFGKASRKRIFLGAKIALQN